MIMKLSIFHTAALSAVLACAIPGWSETSPVPADDLFLQQQYLEALVREFQEIDTRVDDRLGRIVDALSAMEDTRNSKGEVLRTKHQVLDQLGQAVAYYRERMDVLTDDFRYFSDDPNARSDIKAQYDYFAEKGEQRINDIYEITRSLSRHQGFDAVMDDSFYDTTGQKPSQGGAKRDEGRNQALLTSYADDMAGDVGDAMKNDVETMNRQLAALRKSMDEESDPALKADMEDEAGRLEATIAHRMEQLRTTGKPEDTLTRPMGNKETQDMIEVLRSNAAKIREDFARMEKLRVDISQTQGRIWKLLEAGE